MATMPAVKQSKTILHDRGTWPAREDRIPSAVWLGVLWVGMIGGFGLDIKRYLHEKPAPPPILHLHAAVFTMWMLILTAQVLLVLGDRIAWHKRLGWFAAGWACLMTVLGPWAAMASQARGLNDPIDFSPFLGANFLNMACFAVLLAWGIALRKNPAAHRRMMILSSVSLADPGFARLDGYFWPDEPHSVVLWFFYVFYGNVLLIALMAGWDLWRGRLMKSFVIGAGGSLATECVATALYFWPPWKTFTHGLVVAWVKHIG